MLGSRRLLREASEIHAAARPGNSTEHFLTRSLLQPDVNINSANWKSLTEGPADAGPSDGAQPDGGDEVWKSFKSIAEQKQQRVRGERDRLLSSLI